MSLKFSYVIRTSAFGFVQNLDFRYIFGQNFLYFGHSNKLSTMNTTNQVETALDIKFSS